MTEAITHRIIKSGSEVEYYHYKNKPVLRGYSRRPRRQKIQGEKKEKSTFSINRTKREIRRRVNANPDLNKFLTLTSTMTDLGESNKQFNLFTQRMKDRYPEFRYLAVPEFQKDTDFYGKVKPNGGAVHYHLLCNLRFVPAEEIAKDIWKCGSIDIRRVDQITNLGRYISKYLKKDMYDKRFFGKRKIFCSRGLKKSEEFIQDKALFFLDAAKSSLRLEYENTFSNEYLEGEVKIFHLKEN